MTQLVSNWEGLSECKSKDYKIDLDESGYCGWIVPKHETPETERDWFKHHYYLSTHTFYEENYKDATRILRKYGFNVKLVSWD